MTTSSGRHASVSHGGAPRRARGSMLIGIIIGFVLGLIVAAALAFVLTKTPNSFEGKSARSDITNPNLTSAEREQVKQGDRPRFDFSKILPGTEERRSQKEEAPQSAQKVAAAAKTVEPPAEKAGKFYLQAGAYQSVADAEDQRAKLALMGIEASMQSVDVPDKGSINRVRLGPYTSAEEMNRVKADLLKRGVVTAVIRNP